MERRHILRVLAHHGGSRKATAKTLGIGTNTLWRKLSAYGLVEKKSRGSPRPRGSRPGKLGS
jgi:DNA-binding NtrC family response regulator